jgi:hypothetical protein
MKTTREILVAARALIERPEAWTKGALGRDAFGVGVDHHVVAFGSVAVCWCIEGATLRAASGYTNDYFSAMDVLSGVAGDAVSVINDRGTHADALALVDRAIASTSDA